MLHWIRIWLGLGAALVASAAGPTAAQTSPIDACTLPVAMRQPKLVIGSPGEAGKGKITFRATLAFPTVLPSTLDAIGSGLHVRIVDLGNGGATVLDQQIPGTSLGSPCGPSDGWQRRGMSQRYSNRSGSFPPGCTPDSSAGTRSLRLIDASSKGRGLKIAIKTRAATYPAVIGPLRVTVVPGSAADAAAGLCGSTSFLATECSSAGRSLRCAGASAASISAVAGDGQRAGRGSVLPNPFVVRVADAAGQPLAGYAVSFAVTSGGGSVEASVVTDQQGEAATWLTLGDGIGATIIEARAPGLVGSPLTFSAVATNQGAKAGINLERVGEYSRTFAFVDVFKMARPWFAQQVGGAAWNGAPLDLTPEGWVASLQPNQAAVAVLMNDQAGNYPTGPYVCLYDGQGTIQFAGDAVVVSQTPGRIVVQVTPVAGSRTALRITATNPADPIRNIRLVMPGFESDYATQVFHPSFLASLAPFPVIRFLNWTRSNDSPLMHWDERTTLQSAFQSDLPGVALEHIIDLCNRLGADPWINVPHLVDDDFVVQMATLLRDGLDPGLRVHIEHSNEIWGVFEQGDWAEQQGVALGLASDPFTAGIRYHAQRSVEIFDIFESVFGGTDRLVRVLGAGHVNALSVSEVMDWQNAYLHADAVATGAYFGGTFGNAQNAPTTVNMTVPELLAALDVESQRSTSYALANAQAVAARGLDYVAYEGGQALVGVPLVTNLFLATNRDPGMQPLYLAHLQRWQASGGGLFMVFSHMSRYDNSGSWGLLERQLQDPLTSPKWLGVMDFLALP